MHFFRLPLVFSFFILSPLSCSHPDPWVGTWEATVLDNEGANHFELNISRDSDGHSYATAWVSCERTENRPYDYARTSVMFHSASSLEIRIDENTISEELGFDFSNQSIWDPSEGINSYFVGTDFKISLRYQDDENLHGFVELVNGSRYDIAFRRKS